MFLSLNYLPEAAGREVKSMNDLIVKSVDVLGGLVTAVKDEKDTIWVGINYFCQGLDMNKAQRDYQVEKINADKALNKGSRKFPAGVFDESHEMYALRLDFIPMWLAKITITKKMEQDHPELADKLLEYQLKAKDILAAAFLPKQENAGDVQGQIKLLAQGTTELYQKVDAVTKDVRTVKQEIESLKFDLPILPIEADKITEAVKKKGVAVLGGKQSNAYNNRGLRQKLYNDLYANLKYNFGVKSYKSIKRSQCDKAIEVIQRYEPPFFLTVMIDNENSQHTMTWKEMLGDE